MVRFFGKQKKQKPSEPQAPAQESTVPPAQEPVPTTDANVSRLEAEIALQSDRLYGIALFFEGIETLFDGREEIIMANRDQLLGIIQNGTDRLKQAKELLAQVKAGEATAPDVFDFQLADGLENREALIERADALVSVYKRVFSGRDRATPFTEEEKLKLVEAVAAGD
ncbi:MAG: hypothetical protein QGI24_05170 [Kiritimatiellia bacterium]|jgi:hypothetical protein|nr:hypothetical protein [Kiritimatiellia bacterium]MDP6848159.1 hypothetical protein [Kiritimatiellia bacterium]